MKQLSDKQKEAIVRVMNDKKVGVMVFNISTKDIGISGITIPDEDKEILLELCTSLASEDHKGVDIDGDVCTIVIDYTGRRGLGCEVAILYCGRPIASTINYN